MSWLCMYDGCASIKEKETGIPKSRLLDGEGKGEMQCFFPPFAFSFVIMQCFVSASPMCLSVCLCLDLHRWYCRKEAYVMC